MSEKELKSESFFRMYNSAQRRIYAYLLMMVHNHNDAEDLLQETASILWEQFENFDHNKSFAAWAVGIARNKALDFMKSKRNSRPFFTQKLYDDISEIEQDESGNAQKRVKSLHSCIEKLPLKDQKLIRQRFEEGYAVKKISYETGFSADAIYKRLSRLYSVLAECVRRTLAQWEAI